MNQLRLDADTANSKVEELQAKIKALETETLTKEQDITSLQHKNGVLEGQVDKLEGDVEKHKKLADEGSGSITQNETLQRRLQLLEEEAEEADKTLREANEKYVRPHRSSPVPLHIASSFLSCINSWYALDEYNPVANLLAPRLRQTDVKAGHFERKVQALENERDQWETKYEEMSKKYGEAQKEIEDFQREIGAI